VDTTELKFALSNAKTAMQIAVSNLLSKQAGATDVDIKLSEKNVDLAMSHLEDVKKQNELDIKNAELSLKTANFNLQAVEAEIKNSSSAIDFDIVGLELRINQAYSDSIVKSALALTEVDNAINEADRVLGINDSGANDLIEGLLGVRNLQSVNDAISAFNNVAKAKSKYVADYQNVKFDAEHDKILKKLDSIIALVELSSEMMHKVTIVLENTITSSKFSQASLDGYKDKILAEHEKIKSKAEDLNNARQAIDSAELEKKTVESSQAGSLTSNEAKIAAAQQQYESAKLQLENIKVRAVVSENDAANQIEIAQSPGH
jgi:multidrug resistance efflux pump